MTADDPIDVADLATVSDLTDHPDVEAVLELDPGHRNLEVESPVDESLLLRLDPGKTLWPQQKQDQLPSSGSLGWCGEAGTYLGR